jgi:hypothetical protein
MGLSSGASFLAKSSIRMKSLQKTSLALGQLVTSGNPILL